MEKDLLYRAAITHCVAMQWPQFGEAAAQCVSQVQLPHCRELIEEACTIAAGTKKRVATESVATTPLIPIFVTMGGEHKEEYAYSSGELKLQKEFFPKKKEKTVCDHSDTIKSLLQHTELLHDMQPVAFAETLLQMLHKCAVHIPAGIKGLEDVSLYDYARSVAAIAVALFECHNEGQEEKLLLLGADFSGIQQYIYSIVTEKAAKNLKGRSFYLRLLSDTIVRFLLKKTGLYAANVIYNSGGSFYILTPDTTGTRAAIDKAVREIEQAVFNELGTSLFVAIDYVELSKEALQGGCESDNLPDVWGKLFLKRDKKKSHKYSSIITENYASFFNTNSYCNDKRDAVTGEILANNEKVEEVVNEENETVVMKRATKHQIELGKFLRKTNLLLVTDGTLPCKSNKILNIQPLNLGINYYFVEEAGETLASLKKELDEAAEKVTIVTFNGIGDDCRLYGLEKGRKNICAIDFYGGNEAGKMQARSYEEMCKCDGDFSRLGVLRMDVDNLGSIFQTGIRDKASLARYATLSRSFDYFFSGYLNTVWASYEPQYSQIIYSGGDDLFVVGRWDIAIELAQKIRNDFKEYTCYNGKFSLSGGVAIVEPKFPIMVAAETSATEESNAKEHTCRGCPKDAISFLSMPLNWSKEFDTVKKLKDELRKTLDAHNRNDKMGLPKSFISKMLMHYTNADIKNHIVGNFKTFWMMAYDVDRAIKRTSDKDVVALLNNCKNEICSAKLQKLLNNTPIESDYHPLELWALAARWAEFEYRTFFKNS